MKRITETLKILRVRRRLSQEKLAMRIAIPPHRYWQIEQGLRRPTKAERGMIARILKTTPAAIFDAAALAQLPPEKKKAS